MENKKFLGDRISLYRDKLRLNRQEFIDRLNDMLGTTYSAQALYSWEKGKSVPPADMIPPLADILGMSILELFEEELIETDELRANHKLMRELEELKSKIYNLTAQNQRLVGKIEASEFFVRELMRQLRDKDH